MAPVFLDGDTGRGGETSGLRGKDDLKSVALSLIQQESRMG